MINICCINDGFERGRDYVEILHDMVTRNIPKGTFFNFICFTNDPKPYNREIQKRPWKEGNDIDALFQPGLFPDGDRIIYFDLDICITSGLDDLIKYDGEYAAMWPHKSVMIWEAGKAIKAKILQSIFPDSFHDYIEKCQFDIPKGSKIVSFNGKFAPHECQGNWVPFIWKIGGGSSLEFEIAGNVTDKELTANVEYALKLLYETLSKPIEAHDGVLCIVGGGPSLADDVEEIRGRYKGGAVIWALNNSFRYLRDNGIEAHAHVMLDAREKNAEFVLPSPTTRIYASTVHPEVFKAAKLCGGEILIWHPMIAGMLDKLGKKPAVLIGCGNSVGLKAMGLSMVMGFRDVHLYGYDSSYRGDENHAYSQPLNDCERIIEVQVNGIKFKTAPWMAMQADEFKEIAKDLCENHGMKFTIHGDGLLPYVAKLLYSPSN